MISPYRCRANQLNATQISRQHRHFLLLELLIALFLVGTIALPLAELPMQATQEHLKSMQRSQSQRLADNGLAKLKEKLYKNEISWKEISKSSKQRVLLFEDECDLSMPFFNRKFSRKISMKCLNTKKKGTEEWWLMSARVEITPVDRKMSLFKKGLTKTKSKAFAYYVLLHKSSQPAK